MAPDVAEMKALAVAFKMASAFTAIDKIASQWIERGQRSINPESLELNEKNEWLDLRDKWESARDALIKKIERFRKDTGRSPILRYEREVNVWGVHGKVYLGFDSPQAKGYRIVMLDYPIWFEELHLPTDNYSEDRVLSLVPRAQRLDQTQYDLLLRDFLEDLQKAHVPGVYKKQDSVMYPGPKQAEFKRRFDATIDRRRTYNENIVKADNLVEQIKREYALVVAPPRGIAVGPPINPIRIVVPIAAQMPEGHKIEDWYLLYVPQSRKWQLNYKYRDIWDIKNFDSFDDAVNFISQGSGKLYLHAYRNEEFAQWKYPTPITPFKLKVDERWETGQGEDKRLYHLEQPLWNGIQWIWRVTYHGQIIRQQTEDISEFELLQGKFGYGGKTPVVTEKLPQYLKDRLHNYFIMLAKQYEIKNPERLEDEFKQVISPAYTYEMGWDLINKWLEGVYQREKTAAEKLKTTVEEIKETEKLEQEAEKEVELEPEPDQTVYVKILIEGGVPSDDKNKPRIEQPQFTVMATTYDEFAKHGSKWDVEGMWSRPIVGMFGVQGLIEVLNEGELDYDAVEDNQITWGDDWDSIREALIDNPPPFNKYALFHVKWNPQDISWTESAKQAYDIYNHKYTLDDLHRFSKRELQVIAKIKDLDTYGEESVLRERIAGTVPVEEEKTVEEHRCAGTAHILPGAYERFNLPIPKLPIEGFNRPLVAVYKCVDQKNKQVISEEYFCDICAAELESGSYPGGDIFPSMWNLRQWDNIVCRHFWLPGGEEKVRALITRLKPAKPITLTFDQLKEYVKMSLWRQGPIENGETQHIFTEEEVNSDNPKSIAGSIIYQAFRQPNPKTFADERIKAVTIAREKNILEQKTPEKSAADVLAEEALNELASEALDELGEL